MWNYPEHFDVIVIGAGHAGCEAAHASAKMGGRTLLLTMNLDTIAKMSCNPAVGGIAKGHIVREIDALGGIMGKVTDCTGIQSRMLNATKGPAVWAPRTQADKAAYALEMKRRLELVENLQIKQGTTEDLLVEKGKITGVVTKEGIIYKATCVILSAGTFMRGLIHIGEQEYSGGRAGCQPSVGLSAALERYGFQLGRLKTGTPPRIHSRSINFAATEVQPGEEGVYFSFDPPDAPKLPQVPCHITYTTTATRDIILSNIHRSPLYGGKIKGIGPRYCPSIEDKVVRFADKERHQIFLEPEGIQTVEIYVNGVSSSLPFDVQFDYIRSIIGLEQAEIMRPAYAIEYDYAICGQIDHTLETRRVEGLFFAGQINGTTGYEEAAGQGMLAGINAACKVQGRPALVLKRSEAYIGVMIDDLVTKPIDEPYRMFTSRSEYRLLLRQDNADLRLRRYGYALGLISDERHAHLIHKEQSIERAITHLSKTFKQINSKGFSLAQILARPETTYRSLQDSYPLDVTDYGSEINFQIEMDVKYAGYIERQKREVSELDQVERIVIPGHFDYSAVKGLRNEAKEKLGRHKPSNLGQASRIAGVSPADISVMMIALMRGSFAPPSNCCAEFPDEASSAMSPEA